MTIAYFDLDRTLIPMNSAWLWVRYEFREGRLTAGQVARATLWLSAYHVGLGQLQDALRQAIAQYAGQWSDDIAERTRRFYEADLRGCFRPGGRVALEDHQRRGDRCVLLTTSSSYLSALVSEELGLDGFICNRYAVDDAGRLTGKGVEPLCYGQGKVALAAQDAAAQGVGLVDCTFYSDSWSDRPMLEAVGHPVVVNPDQRLRRYAVRQGWTQKDWGDA